MVLLFQTPMLLLYDVSTMTITFFPAVGDKTSPTSNCNDHLTLFKPLQWRKGSVTRAQLAKGQCDSNTLLNKLLTASLREMIIGILLLMLLCSPPPCWLNPANRWVIVPQHPPCPIPSPFTLFTFMSVAARIKPVDHQHQCDGQGFLTLNLYFVLLWRFLMVQVSSSPS